MKLAWLSFYKTPYFNRVIVFRRPNYETLGDIDLQDNGKWKFIRIEKQCGEKSWNIINRLEKKKIQEKVDELNKKHTQLHKQKKVSK